MVKNIANVSLVAALAVFASIGSSCVCPPCQTPGAAPVAGGGATASAKSTSSSSSTATAAAGNRLSIWDGDGHSVSSTAKSWADCDKKGECKAAFAPVKGAGHDGTTGLKLTAEGPGWKGGGWNWFGWWPENSGVDLTPYQTVTFWMRVEAKTPEMMPEPGAITVTFRCSKDKKDGDSQSVSMDKFGKELPDGKWHKVTIPMAELQKDKPKFDLGSAWEMGVGVWTPDPRILAIYVDEIAAENP
jgi:hypothetical protein